VLGTGGMLTAGAKQIGVARKAEQHAAACATQEAREARALAAFAAARDQRVLTAGVSAVQSCPNCGCEVTVLTTLVPSLTRHMLSGESATGAHTLTMISTTR
jgi:hypothetical protein